MLHFKHGGPVASVQFFVMRFFECKMFNPNPGDEIWVNKHWGPSSGSFKLVWPEKKKVLIECNGSPELVELEQCFVSERDCYAAAAANKQREAMAAMKTASEYSSKACGKPDSESA